MSSTDDDGGVPDGFEGAVGRGSHTGTVSAPGRQYGIDHFKGFGAALDQALQATDNANNDVWSVTFSARVRPLPAADGSDPGMVIEYTATLM